MANSNPNKNIFTIFLIYLAVCLVFIFFIGSYGESQKQKDLVKLQAQLSSVMDIRSSSVSKWLREREGAVTSISENLTVKMFLATAINKKAERDDLLTQQQFTGAYLESVAKNYGFKKPNSGAIKANVPNASEASIILLDNAGKNLLSIDYAENLKAIMGNLSDIPSQKPLSIVKSEEDGAAYIKIIKPITKVQSEEVLGFVVAIKKFDKEFFDILNFPPSEYKTLSSKLFIKNLNELVYVSNVNGRSSIDVVQNNQDSAEVFAINNPDLISIKNSVEGSKVFVSSKKIGGTGLYIVQTLGYNESFSDVDNNTRNIKRISYLLALLLGAVIAFVWKHAISEKYKKLNTEIREKQRLLKLITENQIQSMLLIDESDKISFANRIFMSKNKIKSEEEYLNKEIASVVGTSVASDYTDMAFKAHEANIPVTTLSKMKIKDKDRFLQRRAIPILSTEPGNEFKGTLLVENDITETINERIKYEQNLNNSIEILVRIIENRSKYFHNHGSQVHELSLKIAQNLDIPDVNLKALDIASRICNLSLALLPRDLLNKAGDLSEDEKGLFNTIPQKTIEIIRDFNFDSPVIETLEQMNERVDGKGPKALGGDRIIISARIIKAVNDYVAMISPRPYRDRLTSEQAIENLLKDKDSKYSKEVVFALANIVGRK